MPERQRAGIARRQVVEVVLPAERSDHGQLRRLGPGAQVGRGLGAPAAAADDDERPLGRSSRPRSARKVSRGRRERRGGEGARRRRRPPLRARPPAARPRPARAVPTSAVRNARATTSGTRAALSTSTTHFAIAAEHALVVELLERLTLRVRARHLADEQHERRRVLERGVDAGRRHASRPAPRVTRQIPGRPVSLP